MKVACIFFIALIIHCSVAYITHLRIKKNKGYLRKPLADIIHNNTNDYSKYSYIVDYAALIFVLPLLKSYSNNECTAVLSRFISVFSVLVIMRSFALLVTDMPPSDPTCNPHNLDIYNILFGHCHDKLFSGHTTFTLLCILIAYQYGYMHTSELTIMLLFQIMYAFMVIITRSHYTVDVLLSYYITVPILAFI
jgi:hypothetical protein